MIVLVTAPALYAKLQDLLSFIKFVSIGRVRMVAASVTLRIKPRVTVRAKLRSRFCLVLGLWLRFWLELS